MLPSARNRLSISGWERRCAPQNGLHPRRRTYPLRLRNRRCCHQRASTRPPAFRRPNVRVVGHVTGDPCPAKRDLTKQPACSALASARHAPAEAPRSSQTWESVHASHHCCCHLRVHLRYSACTTRNVWGSPTGAGAPFRNVYTSARRRTGPSLGEHQQQGLPLPWRSLLRHDQAGQLHDRGCGEGGWRSSRPREGMHARVLGAVLAPPCRSIVVLSPCRPGSFGVPSS